MAFANRYITKKSQVGMIQQAFVAVIIVLVVILLSITVLGQNRETLLSSVEDLSCTSYLSAYATAKPVSSIGTALGYENFMAEYAKYCKTEQLYLYDIDNKKEEAFEKLADASRRCYKRYGSGELNFLGGFSNQRKGEYCFVCSKVDVVQQRGQISSQEIGYTELGEWMSDNTPNDKNPEDLSYTQLSNLFYITGTATNDANSEFDINDLRDGFKEVVISDNSKMRSVYEREFSSDESLYVVLRYNLIEEGTACAIKSFIGIRAILRLRYGWAGVASMGTNAAGCFWGTDYDSSLTTLEIDFDSLEEKDRKFLQRMQSALEKLEENTNSEMLFKSSNEEELAKLYRELFDLTDKEVVEFKNEYIELQTDTNYISVLEDNIPNIDRYLIFNIVFLDVWVREFKDTLEELNGSSYEKLGQLLTNIENDDFTSKEELENVLIYSAQAKLSTLPQTSSTDLFSQYTEIIPESEMYAICGQVYKGR